jgi:hypothetical protein
MTGFPVQISGTKNTVDLLAIISADCPRPLANKIMDLCGVYYPDRIGR